MKKVDIEIDQIKKTIKKHGWDKAENIIMYCSWQSWKNYEFVKITTIICFFSRS